MRLNIFKWTYYALFNGQFSGPLYSGLSNSFLDKTLYQGVLLLLGYIGLTWNMNTLYPARFLHEGYKHYETYYNPTHAQIHIMYVVCEQGVFNQWLLTFATVDSDWCDPFPFLYRASE